MTPDIVYFDGNWELCDKAVAVYARVRVRDENGIVAKTETHLISREREREHEAREAAKVKPEKNSLARFVAEPKRK